MIGWPHESSRSGRTSVDGAPDWATCPVVGVSSLAFGAKKGGYSWPPIRGPVPIRDGLTLILNWFAPLPKVNSVHPVDPPGGLA